MTYNVDNKNNLVDLKNAIQFQNTEDVNVIDLEAENICDIKDSYVGKYIAQCDICNQLIYVEDKDLEKIEACPYCGFDHCFYLIGQVAAITPNEYEETLKAEDESKLYDKSQLVYGEAADNEVTQ